MRLSQPRLWRVGGIALSVLILILRRTDQLTDPQVWVEEGSQIIPGFLARGASAILEPVNGYLVTVSKLIAYAALSTGGLSGFPGVSSALGLCFEAAVLAWIATAPLMLAGGSLLALAVVLVPTDVEVFIVGEYSCWFAGLALFTLILWRTDDDSRAAGRLAVALIGGLSSPIVVLLTPIAGLRFLRRRSPVNLAVTMAMAGSSLTQLWFISRLHLTSYVPAPSRAALVMARYLAEPFLIAFKLLPSDRAVYAVAFVHLLGLIAAVAPPPSRPRRLLTLGLFLIAAASAMVRHPDPTIIHPVLGGPRYFFYPYLMLMWFWIDVGLTAHRGPRLATAAAGLLMLCTTFRYFTRHHDHLPWKEAVARLMATGDAALPFHYDGDAAKQYSLHLVRCGQTFCRAP